MLFGALLVIAPAAAAANDGAAGRASIDVPGPVVPGTPAVPDLQDGPETPVVPDPGGAGLDNSGNKNCVDIDAVYDVQADGAGQSLDPDDLEDSVRDEVASGDNSLALTYTFRHGTIEFETVEGSLPVSAVFVKQASNNSNEDAGASVELEFPAAVTSADVTFTHHEFSHITFCAVSTSPPPPADTDVNSLTVVKKVVGAPAGSAPSFTFESDAGPFDGPLGDGGTQPFDDLADGEYAVTEIAGDTYDLTSVVCSDGTDETSPTITRVANRSTVTVDLDKDGAANVSKAVTCTFTNAFVPDEANIQDPKPEPEPNPEPNPAAVVIREVVVGTPPDKVPADWAFGFTAKSTDGVSEVSAAARTTFELTDDDSETTFSVEPGSSLDVSQDPLPKVDGGVWSFLGAACQGADGDDVTAAGQAVTVTPDADDVITCTFTAEFTALEVLPAPAPVPTPVATPTPAPTPAVTPAPVPAPAPAAKPTEVLGETVTRDKTPQVLGVQTTRLAITGTGSFRIAGFGLVLLMLGGVMVAASRLGRLREG